MRVFTIFMLHVQHNRHVPKTDRCCLVTRPAGHALALLPLYNIVLYVHFRPRPNLACGSSSPTRGIICTRSICLPTLQDLGEGLDYSTYAVSSAELHPMESNTLVNEEPGEHCDQKVVNRAQPCLLMP